MTRKPREYENNYIGYYGDFVSRTAAIMIDAGAISISFTLILWLINVTVTTMQFRTIVGFTLNDFPEILSFVDSWSRPEIIAVIAILYMICYILFFYTLTGQTIGKALLGLRIVTVDGKHLSFWQSCVRLIAFFFCVATLFLGLIWVLFDNKRQGWHDKIARTYVIYTWDALPDENFLADEIFKATGQYPEGYTPPTPKLPKL